MGRPGAGGAGGGFHSTGGHSMGHSTSGHHMGSSGGRGGRPGAGSSYSGGSNHHSSYGGGYGGGYGRGYRSGRYYGSSRSYRRRPASVASTCATIIVVFAVIFIFAIYALFSSYRYDTSSGSTIVREKLESGNGFMNDCIEDELGWFENENKAEAELKKFWEETGVQPYIYLKDYDAGLQTDADKEAWATDYYTSEFSSKGREDICLYVYFADADTEGTVGYMTLTEGFQAATVMDSEAESILYSNIDSYWYQDITMNEVFANSFEKTGQRIMKVGKTVEEAKADFMKAIAGMVAAFAAIVVGVIAYKNAAEKRLREKEKEEATERMINTPLETYESKGVDDAASELSKKYENTDKSQET